MKHLGKLAITSSLILLSSTLSAATVYSTACINCQKERPKKYTEPSPIKQTPVSTKKSLPQNTPSVILSSDLGTIQMFSPDDLLDQQPSLNEDLILLQQRQHYSFSKPVLELSGALEANLMYNEQATHNQNLTLGTAEFDAQFIPSDWVAGLASIGYDSDPTGDSNSAAKSTLNLNRGFITLGNLDKFPLYFTMGKMYVPFGQYSSAMVTDPSITSMGRILTPTAVLGAYFKGLNMAAFAYSGNKSDNSKFVNQWGGRIGFDMTKDDFNVAVNASYVSNLGDAAGMQEAGFNQTPQTKDVAAADGAIKLGYKFVDFTAEYLTAVESFSNHMTFKGKAARPSAVQGELNFSWEMLNRPFSFGAFYNHTWQALSLNLPKDTFGAVFSTSLFKHTKQAIEYRRDIQYKATATAPGSTDPITQHGSASNTISLMVGAYF